MLELSRILCINQGLILLSHDFRVGTRHSGVECRLMLSGSQSILRTLGDFAGHRTNPAEFLTVGRSADVWVFVDCIGLKLGGLAVALYSHFGGIGQCIFILHLILDHEADRQFGLITSILAERANPKMLLRTVSIMGSTTNTCICIRPKLRFDPLARVQSLCTLVPWEARLATILDQAATLRFQMSTLHQASLVLTKSLLLGTLPGALMGRRHVLMAHVDALESVSGGSLTNSTSRIRFRRSHSILIKYQGALIDFVVFFILMAEFRGKTLAHVRAYIKMPVFSFDVLNGLRLERTFVTRKTIHVLFAQKYIFVAVLEFDDTFVHFINNSLENIQILRQEQEIII